MSTAEHPRHIEEAAAELRALLGTRVTDGMAVREHHSHGESYHPPHAPDLVCFPATTAEVSAILKVSQRFQVPVIPFGAGTSLEGHVHALNGGISIDLRDMNRVLRVGAEDLDATVEAGVTRKQLNTALRNTGLTFPVDPGADATIAGMAATRASGTTAVRYGTMRENVLALTVVLADGRVIHTGTRARKSAAGYDLTRLFVGSEGTLGVITELTVRLHPLPEATAAAVCPFDSIRGAVDTVIATIQLGIPIARIELLDEVLMDAVNRYSKTSYPVAPTLFFEFHGDSERTVAEQAEAVQALAADHGGHAFEWARRPEDRDRLWQARHDVHYASLALRRGSRSWATDVCVPISRLADCVIETKQDHAGAPFPVCLVGHAGDGNFHVIYLIDPASEAELAQVHDYNARVVARALAMGGTCTGEHGVGYGKIASLEAEHGEAVDVMRSIKLALDPDNRMNPGKVVRVGVIATLLLAGTALMLDARQVAAPPPGAPVAPSQVAPALPPQPTILLAPGLREVPDYRKLAAPPPPTQIAAGFTALFNGKDLSGWHISTTARHGVTPDFHVAHGMILGTQRPLGGGGLLITDRKYRNFELSMEVKPDWGNDSGIFLRTTETGAAYQVTLDYLPGGSMGRLIGEGGIQFGAGRGAGAGASPAAAAAPAAAAGAAAAGAGRAQAPDPGMTAWKREDWNVVRVRVAGDVPHATVWINDQQVSDATDTENHALDGMVEGPIAIQIHGGTARWQPGGIWRWRNLAIKELGTDAK